MPDVLLTLVVPADIAESVEDVLLGRPDLVSGFTSSPADGHGRNVALQSPADRVMGHAPRCRIQAVGDEAALRGLLGEIRRVLPLANIFYWLAPVIEAGRL